MLDAMARTAPVVGAAPGDGQKVKLVNQLLCGVHIAVAAEALAFAEAMGLDAETTWEVIRHGAAASFMLDDRGQRMVHGAFEQVNSALDIFVKDMGLVIDAARQHGHPVPTRRRHRAALPCRTARRTRPAGRLLGHRDPARRSRCIARKSADRRRDSELRPSMISTVSSRLSARRARDGEVKEPARGQLSLLGYGRENSAARRTWSSVGRTPV